MLYLEYSDLDRYIKVVEKETKDSLKNDAESFALNLIIGSEKEIYIVLGR